ncbi:MAG TPA: alpha-glucuronidase family glycosyl hydrolase [Terriglobia bacterium]|nr:alpha-glucuronidase family glycosyl hydrolase [Terriglobia bacterium]
MNRRRFLKQAGGYLGSAAGISLQPSGRADWTGVEPYALADGQRPAGGGGWCDLGKAQIFSPPGLSPREERALRVLAEEVEKRTQLRLPLVPTWPSNSTPTFVAGTNATLQRLRSHLPAGTPEARGADGYALRVTPGDGPSVVTVAGTDERGVLYGVGKLMRSLRMTRLRVEVEGHIDIASSPQYALRGHQLGYRPKANSYDGWTVGLWDQYIRELALFGCNLIELIPPRSDDNADSPHFTLPPKEMMIEMSHICNEYDLDVWIWYPAMERDYSDSATVDREVAAWGEIFQALPRIDAVFVPGGDPGHTEPKFLMSLLEKQAQNLRRYHPKGQIWVSPQSFSQAWFDEFLGILKAQPPWLSGVVFGPQTRVDLPTMRMLVPARYPIRLYPDITHTLECQFPVPDWDVALALTEGREPICPRPEGFANIARRYLPYSAGFGSYSEGCNDDVNKFVWNALAWNPEAKVIDILRDYSRFFISHRYAEDFAQGLLELEKAWQGPLLANENVESTLTRFRAMESAATPAELLNWRFQQGLYRAYYDAYVRRRLIYETDLYNQALDKLEAIHAVGSQPVAVSDGHHTAEPTNALDASVVIAEAQSILAKVPTQPVAQELRTRILQLGEALFQSIRMQLAMELYQAEDVDRGGNLDTLDAPLTNGPWLTQRLREIGALPAAREQIAAIEEVLNRTNPGPGGFYDDLGDIARPSRLVRGPGPNEDPEFRQSVLIGHDYPLPAGLPLAWKRWAEALYDAPLRMHYMALDPQARYKIRVVYAGDAPHAKIRLACEGGPEIHPFISKLQPVAPLEFDIPAVATASGDLTLVWTREPGLGGNGRGTQVAEVWLVVTADHPAKPR